MSAARTPGRHVLKPARCASLFDEMPHDVAVALLEELDAHDLARLARVSRSLRDLTNSPTIWRKLCSRTLAAAEGPRPCLPPPFPALMRAPAEPRMPSRPILLADFGPLPGAISRAVVVRQHMRDKDQSRLEAGTASASTASSARKGRSWEDDWSLPLCDWLPPSCERMRRRELSPEIRPVMWLAA